MSEELRNIIQSEFEDRRKVVGVMLADMGMGFVIETLLFCLQEATTSYNTTAIPMVMAVEPKPSTMIRAALAIDKLLMIDTSQTIDILLNSNFAELLVDCLGSNYQDIELLLVITLKMMKGNKGELNLEAQRAFQQAFLGKRRPMAMKFIRRVLTDELNNMIGSQGAKTSLEREVEMRLNNKREETNVYLKTVNTVECLCQSLNFDIKEVFGESENR
ncbi:MAG: hypothetical protein JST59_00890 [Actinobacteria bacterium]|nr:hypothetical protein [Actinomycetota bacterium]